jgi:AraC-like DNA-binding protein
MPATRPTAHLSDHDGIVFESSEPERTEAFLATAFGAAMKINGDRTNYRFRLARLGAGPVQITTVDHTPTTETRADAMPDHLAVVRMHRGVRINVDLDDLLGPGDLSVHAQSGRPVHTRVAAARYTAVFLPTQAAEEAARNRPDDRLGPLRFGSLRPAGPSATRRWLDTIEYVSESLRSHPEAMAQPLLSGATTRLLAAALLSTFPNTWNPEPHHQDRIDATPTTLSRAITFIETNADIDIAVVDIARAAHVTVRAVQLAFRRHLDTTPLAYLRRVRLDRAHEDLRTATRDSGITITQIAARWGFADPSRFTALYRATFGQPPSHRLRD